MPCSFHVRVIISGHVSREALRARAHVDQSERLLVGELLAATLLSATLLSATLLAATLLAATRCDQSALSSARRAHATCQMIVGDAQSW